MLTRTSQTLHISQFSPCILSAVPHPNVLGPESYCDVYLVKRKIKSFSLLSLCHRHLFHTLATLISKGGPCLKQVPVPCAISQFSLSLSLFASLSLSLSITLAGPKVIETSANVMERERERER